MHPHFRSPRIALAEKTNMLSHVAGLSARDRPNFAWKLPRKSYALDPSQSSSCTIGLLHPGVFGVEIASPGNTSCPVSGALREQVEKASLTRRRPLSPPLPPPSSSCRPLGKYQSKAAAGMTWDWN